MKGGVPAWSYRCFHLRPYGDGWKAMNSFPALSGGVPQTFKWSSRDDRDGLCRYIDAALLGQRSEMGRIEALGFVSELEYYHFDRPKDTILRVSVRRFAEFMTLRDHFHVPLWGKIHFITDRTNIIPREFIAALGQVIGEDGKFIDPDADWHHCTEKDLTAMGLKPSDVTSSLYADQAAAPGASVEIESPDAAPREIEISRDIRDRYIDLTTRVEPAGEAKYFARRIMTLRGVLLWSATSFYLHGPWKVWSRSSAELLGLGLDL